MKKNTSIKGEYGIGFEMGGTEIRDLQSLLNSRRMQMAQVSANGFGSVEHKMEQVKTYRGVEFVNDAASCNANSVYAALSNLNKKTVWITSFEQWGEVGAQIADLMQSISKNISYVVFLGNENSPSRSFLEGLGVSSEPASDMESAVRMAFYLAGSNHAVLYCPGVPAAEQSIEERGHAFKSAVAQL